MRILIWGAGGIGCYYGSRLQLAGHEITYVARKEHLAAMQNKGLVVKHEHFQFADTVNAIDQQTLQTSHHCDDFDLIILTLKNTETQSVLQHMRDWLLQGHCPLLSLQNGVDNEPQIAALIGPSRTIGGLAVRIGGHIVEPGVIEAKGLAQVVLGGWPNEAGSTVSSAFILKVQHSFTDAGIPTSVSDDIHKELWRKLLINNGVNPLSALTRLDTKRLTSNPVLGKTVYKMMQETADAAKFDGVELTQSDIDEMFRLISDFDAIKTSMLVDREKGRPLELDYICGAVISRCEKLGLDAPFTELMLELLRLEISND
ncbi:MAG: 2-dehydropantoate 2-reductase [Paraglaciecola sp.]|jgi:2-dehydropantoate 2-reductase